MATKHGLRRKAHFLGTKIRSLRKRHNLTLEDLSVRCIQIDAQADKRLGCHELTYGLERIAMFLGRKDSIYDIEWGGTLPYGAVRLEDERESSIYGFEVADVEMLRRHLGDWEREAESCLDHDPPLVVPALEATLKISHLFNLLDARGAVSVTEEVADDGAITCTVHHLALDPVKSFSPKEKKMMRDAGRLAVCSGKWARSISSTGPMSKWSN